MSNTIEELKLNISNFMSLYLEHEGFSPLVGKMYTLLLFSSEPISLQQMAEELSVSKAAISVQIRTMELKHLCHKVPIQNDRKDYYYITDDFGINIVRNEIGKFNSVKQAVDGALAGFPHPSNVESHDEEGCNIIRRRFQNMSMLCGMFISRMGELHEEWQLKRPLP
ncbi:MULTISPECIES: GbsR/MarR family transcriptional regulator [Paenibacillus]|uniref:MarR family transcriptional regulator n=1 Tax=Paenibacillus radicis (ex Xue et al. 2023) TaxID=2972489 RepID=A0ABT1YEP6_9BACL|nr:MarR family transcriptional regulator [Paenibacillus radicis (ex Xue et al. 2023)]MCR8631658.1 MarR family transcriptional regulator [Paenibacillus radicis (ex Xue et al. 2023)]